MQLLAAVPLTGHRVLLQPSQDYATVHGVLRDLLLEAEGSEVAGLFAEPKRQPDRIEFFVPDGQVARYEELDQTGRDRVRAEVGRLVSLLRRTAERAAARDPQRCGGWPELVRMSIEVPSFEYVFAHEGRPVLTGWAMAPGSAPNGLGLLAVLDDGLARDPPRRFPVVAAAAAAVLLMSIGGLAAVVAPYIGDVISPPAPVCRIPDGDRQALIEVDREKKRELELRRSLAEANKAMGDKRANCPIPVIRQTPPVRAEPQVQSPPPPQAEAPKPPVRPTPPPQKAEAPPPAPPAQRPPDARPCNTETKSGGAGITSTKHFLGSAPGRVRLFYDTLSQPDRIAVYHQGRRIAGTAEGRNRGFVSGRGGFEFDWNPPPNGPPGSYVVTVEVTGTPGSSTTEWKYNLGCPSR